MFTIYERPPMTDAEIEALVEQELQELEEEQRLNPSHETFALRAAERMAAHVKREVALEAEKAGHGSYTGPGEEDERDPRWLAANKGGEQ